MERFVLANILANIDFDLLISDDVRNMRGYWGEVMEIRFPKGVVFVCIDENILGYVRMYRKEQVEMVAEIEIRENNCDRVMKTVINKAKTMFA